MGKVETSPGMLIHVTSLHAAFKMSSLFENNFQCSVASLQESDPRHMDWYLEKRQAVVTLPTPQSYSLNMRACVCVCVVAIALPCRMLFSASSGRFSLTVQCSWNYTNGSFDHVDRDDTEKHLGWMIVCFIRDRFCWALCLPNDWIIPLTRTVILSSGTQMFAHTLSTAIIRLFPC